MPAFSFEKISRPPRRAATPQPPAKPRGVIGQIIDRMSEARSRRRGKVPTTKPGQDSSK